MKTTHYFTFMLLIIAMFAFVASSFAQIHRPIVKVIYLLPSDRAPRPDIDIMLDTEIKDAQLLFADIMEKHGFGRKTFSFETDARGMAVVHHVKGKHTAAHYYNFALESGVIIDELFEHFDLSKNIYLVSVDMGIVDDQGYDGFANNITGFAYYSHGGAIGIAVVSVSDLPPTAHELAHAFGLVHDYRFLVETGKHAMLESFCAASWLDANSYFNDTPILSNSPTTFQMLPPQHAPGSATRLRFEINDSDGLHQVQLLTTRGPVFHYDPKGYISQDFPPPGDISVQDCKILTGVSNTVEFVTPLLIPAQEIVDRGGAVQIRLGVIDVHGNITEQSFTIDVLSVAEPIPIPDTNLAATLREKFGLAPNTPITQGDMLGLEEEFVAVGRRITNLTGLQHAILLQQVNLLSNQIDDITPLLGLPLFSLSIGDNQIRDLTPLKALTNLAVLHIGGNPFSDITVLPSLKNLRSLALASSPINDISPVWELTQLGYLSIRFIKIHDLSPITKLTALRTLQLDDNGISDISPLTALTNLETLSLNRNPISNVSPLAALTNLETLSLRDTLIKDRKPLHAMLQKNPDIKIYLTWDGEPLMLSDFRAEQQEPIHHTIKRHTGMYWIEVEADTLHHLIGENVEIVLPNVENATSLALDAAKDKLYWTEKTSNRTGRIRRANLDGTNVELVKDLTSVPLDLDLDTAAGKLYLTNSWGKVQRLNVDGSNFQSNLIIGLKSPKHIAVDVAGGKIYWAEQTSDTTGKIQRANLDGSDIQLVKSPTAPPRGLALDAANGKLYFANAWGKIQRLNFDGSKFETDLITGLDAPEDIAVDVISGKVYWAEKGKIGRASLTGENIEDVITGLDVPVDIALSSLTQVNSAAPAWTLLASPETAYPLPTDRPEASTLLPNYPNPFNPETWIPYQLAEPAEVSISIYSANGKLIRTLALGYQPIGIYESRSRAAYWDGRNALGEPVASGVYFYTLTAGKFTATRKMLIMK